MSSHRQAFDAITAEPRYLANLDWREARPGHPEGTVRAHIAEIELNLEALRPKITDDVRRFAANQPQEDDMTAVILKMVQT